MKVPTLLDIPDADITVLADGRLAITRATMEKGGWAQPWIDWVCSFERHPYDYDIWLLPAHWKLPVRRVERVDGFPVAPPEPDEDGA